MILSNVDIEAYLASGELVIEPYGKEYLQPASYDLHLHEDILVYAGDHRKPQGDFLMQNVQYPDRDNKEHFFPTYIPDDGFPLWPGQCVLGRTEERFEFPEYIVGKLEGVSTNARIFLIIHSTAGFFDPGFRGTATLEIVNLSPRVTILTRGLRIAQMSFTELKSKADPYDGRYQGQIDPTATRNPRIRR